jgi:hypothetical protein
MKKYLLYCLSIVSFLLFSCSNEGYGYSEDIILPKTLNTIYPDHTEKNYATTIVYNGNEIVTITNKDQRIVYGYNDNRIVSEIKYIIKNQHEIKYSETIYEYENEGLKTVSQTVNGQETKWIYNKNADGSIAKETYSFDAENKKEQKNLGHNVLTIINGNLINLVSDWEYGDVVTCGKYEYDGNNNPFKNVLGFDLLLDQEAFGLELNISSANNLTKHNYYPITSGNIVFEPYCNTIKYEYNQKGYPTKKTTYDYAGRKLDIVEFVY